MLTLKSDKGIQLSKTFPHIFSGKIKYRTDANLRVDLINSPIIRRVFYDLKDELTKRINTSKIVKYFNKCDREASEIIDYCGEVFDAYKVYIPWQGDIDKEWDELNDDTDE